MHIDARNMSWCVGLDLVVGALCFSTRLSRISNLSQRHHKPQEDEETLQWVQDAEDVEAWNGQVAKWEEDQAPGNAKQNGDSQQGTDVPLGSVTVTLPKLFALAKAHHASDRHP